jgi:hypothetical protein
LLQLKAAVIRSYSDSVRHFIHRYRWSSRSERPC